MRWNAAVYVARDHHPVPHAPASPPTVGGPASTWASASFDGCPTAAAQSSHAFAQEHHQTLSFPPMDDERGPAPASNAYARNGMRKLIQELMGGSRVGKAVLAEVGRTLGLHENLASRDISDHHGREIVLFLMVNNLLPAAVMNCVDLLRRDAPVRHPTRLNIAVDKQKLEQGALLRHGGRESTWFMGSTFHVGGCAWFLWNVACVMLQLIEYRILFDSTLYIAALATYRERGQVGMAPSKVLGSIHALPASALHASPSQAPGSAPSTTPLYDSQDISDDSDGLFDDMTSILSGDEFVLSEDDGVVFQTAAETTAVEAVTIPTCETSHGDAPLPQASAETGQQSKKRKAAGAYSNQFQSARAPDASAHCRCVSPLLTSHTCMFAATDVAPDDEVTLDVCEPPADSVETSSAPPFFAFTSLPTLSSFFPPSVIDFPGDLLNTGSQVLMNCISTHTQQLRSSFRLPVKDLAAYLFNLVKGGLTHLRLPDAPEDYNVDTFEFIGPADDGSGLASFELRNTDTAYGACKTFPRRPHCDTSCCRNHCIVTLRLSLCAEFGAIMASNLLSEHKHVKM